MKPDNRMIEEITEQLENAKFEIINIMKGETYLQKFKAYGFVLFQGTEQEMAFAYTKTISTEKLND